MTNMEHFNMWEAEMSRRYRAPKAEIRLTKRGRRLRNLLLVSIVLVAAFAIPDFWWQ